MKNLHLEIILCDKTLVINGKKKYQLEESLFAAELTRVLNRENELALELRYQNKDKGFIIEESENIYRFLECEKAGDRIDVNFYPEWDFPTIALVGSYTANIHA